MPNGLQGVIIALLGAGGATFLWTVVRSYLAIRNSAETREDKAIARLDEWRLDADRRATQAAAERDIWRARSGDLEHLLRINGVPVPPSQQQFYDMFQVPYWSGTGPYPSIKVRMDFRGPDIGDFVYHCHILGHEDNGMMAIIRVLPHS